MGVEPFLLSSSLLGVLAQRLVRKLCPQCREPDPARSGWHAGRLRACDNTGYKGRTGIYELISVDDELRGADPQPRRRRASCARRPRRNGLRSMREDGERWVADGITSLEEVLRVTRD